MELSNQIALVTGASSGIGKATALLFAQEGARMVIAGRNTDALAETAAEVQKAGSEAVIQETDVSKQADCERVVEKAITEFGRLNILVNAAGVIASGTIGDTSVADWHKMMHVNLDSVFYLTQLALPHLEKTKGSVVNVSSVGGVRSFPGILAYSVSKAAVDQLTRCSALELAGQGVRVNAVNPGVVVTELHRRGGFDEKKYAEFLEHSKTTHPLGRVGQPAEIAEAILYLASSRSGWVTGVTLSIDGGRHLTCAR